MLVFSDLFGGFQGRPGIADFRGLGGHWLDGFSGRPGLPRPPTSAISARQLVSTNWSKLGLEHSCVNRSNQVKFGRHAAEHRRFWPVLSDLFLGGGGLRADRKLLILGVWAHRPARKPIPPLGWIFWQAGAAPAPPHATICGRAPNPKTMGK